MIAYLEAENANTASVLEPLNELRETLFGEFKARIKETDLSVPVEKDGWSYYTRTEEGLSYPIQCRRLAEGDGPELVLFDENVEAEGKDFFDLGVFEVSPNHRLLLWASDTAGDERFLLRVRDLDSGLDLDDNIPDVSYGSAWAMDSTTFFYVRADHANRPYQVWRHVLGNPSTEDILVLEEPDERFFVGVGRERDDSFIQISASSAVTDETWLLPATNPTAQPRCLQQRRQGIEYSAAHHNDQFVIITNDEAENFKLVTTPDDETGAENWADLIPNRADVHLSGFDALSEHLVLFERVNAVVQMRVRHWQTAVDHIVEQPEAVSSVWPGANPTQDTTSYRYGYSSMKTPASVLLYDLNTKARTLLKATEVLGGFHPDQYETSREWAVAEDGTRVPMSLVWRKDRPVGPGPCLLGGYGAYEISAEPAFSTMRLSLLDRGFVVAIAHVRGGGELGRAWYLDGKFEHKPNTFTDTVACAKHLIDLGLTSPSQLGIRGGSAGGLLVGATLNLAPELFGAALAEVPFVDALNTILDPSLPLTVTEWEELGNPAESEEIFRVMQGYTPYENVRPENYPAILATAGLNDPRVGFWEPAKWVQVLRQVTTGTAPILLQTEMGAGHAGPSGRYDAWRDEARALGFLISALHVERATESKVT